MPRHSQRPPSYRRRVVRGKSIAYVTLRDSATGRRRDYWLGEYGTPESRARYARLLAEWEARQRYLPQPTGAIRPADGLTVTQLVAEYWQAIRGRYSHSHECELKIALRRWREHFGREPAIAIGPVALRDWRATIAHAVSLNAAARHAGVVIAMYRWAAAQELLPIEVYQRLKTIEPLRHHRRQPVGPAPIQAVAAVRDHVSRQVRAMIDLQLLTGMRPGEVCTIRPCDLQTSDRVWLYTLPEHKTAYRDHQRIIYLGPQAQAILRPFLARPTTHYMFSPAEAEMERRAKRHALRRTSLTCGNRPGTTHTDRPRRSPGMRYTNCSYRRAIERACERLAVQHWHPHQLRHNYATEVRKRYGLEASRILLGHCSALVTEAVYAERDQQAAMRIAAEIG